MIPLQKVREIIIKYDNLEKELSSGNVDPKLFAKKSKEYSEIGGIISIAREYVDFENIRKDLEHILEDKSSEEEIIEMAKKDLNDMEKKKNYTKTNLRFFYYQKMKMTKKML